MQVNEFQYDLPPELIAQYPAPQRSRSRLLVLDGATGRVDDRQFIDLEELLAPGDLLVLNNTRVIRARLYGRKDTGGQVELLVERILGTHHVLAQLRASKPPQLGSRLTLDGEVRVQVLRRVGEFYELRFDGTESAKASLERIGHVPLPPYITRREESLDRERYQTVYARVPGAVAAPTAGLHFDANMLECLATRGVQTTFLTLHIGAGTFQPLRVADIRDHRMHAEYIDVDETICTQVNAAKARGARVIAVGTTVTRALETVARNGRAEPFSGDTTLYIYPGFRFQLVDAMVTNFHLPGSSLLILVCAFAGTERVLHAYRHAVEQRYRFYSYGDSMFVTSQRRYTSAKM
ncbi:MAG: tRNA preQ1(34) S-adenosylmethionine ribosyltransferase-isomerase QueA [Acidiferrobacterales bacterium]